MKKKKLKSRINELSDYYLQVRRENTDLKEEIAMLRMREGDGRLWERIKEWFRRVI
jgi:hypothetical protein